MRPSRVAVACLAISIARPVTADDGPSISQACLDQISSHATGLVDPGGPVALTPSDAVVSGIADGKLRYLKGHYDGKTSTGEHQVTVYPKGMHLDPSNTDKDKLTPAAMSGCSPYMKGHSLGTVVHELYHSDSLCGASTGDDCIHISINIATAGKLCDKAGELKACLESEECPPLAGHDDLESNQDVQDMLDGVCDRHGAMQERHNSEENREQAKACACGGTYMPPTGCPTIPQPPGGCDEDPPAVGYPIADCGECASGEGEGGGN